ncbi:CaiB/BaiF CoA transferase family protein [Parasphingorhabdus halotolerans]|nr:CaiB/BaiF CoA-transferase family protein [Parasphingorhabdus halotolerans]
MLSDLGADVLKIEPPEGDVTRTFSNPGGGAAGFYMQQNIGKRNICLDLKQEAARDLARKLAAEADIVVENFRPGVMAKFGLAWEDLKKLNPKLVMLSISGFGQTGPEAKRAAYAPIIHAESGLIGRQAQMSGGPAYDMQFAMADSYTSLHGLIGVLAALRVAEKTGQGQQIDMTLLNALHASDDYANWALDGTWPRPVETIVWQAPEDMQLLIVGDMRWLWHCFSTMDDLQDPTPKGADLTTKIKLRREAMEHHIASYESFDALTKRLDAMNLAWGKVNEFGPEIYEQESIKHRGIVVDIEDDIGNARRTVQSPYRFSESQSGLPSGTRLSRRGEHNLEALEDWLGLPADEVEALADAGVLLRE